jgi:dipeptidyl aminopeptidase/acylaminoacyl peptidase
MNAKKMIMMACVALLAGCDPEERLWWSPQGDRAVVRVGDELRLMDAEGHLGEVVMGKDATEKVLVSSVSWLPDGSGFVTTRVRVIARWADARPLIPASEAEKVEAMQPAVLALLQTASKTDAKLKVIDQFLKHMPEQQVERLMQALRVNHQSDPVALETLLNATPDGKEALEWLKKPGEGFTVYEVCLCRLQDGHVEEIRTLAASLRAMVLPRVSPDGRRVAVVHLNEDREDAALVVMTLDGKSRVTASEATGTAYDWMPDGRSLVLMTPVGKDDDHVEVIHRITIADEKDQLIEKPKTSPALAMAITQLGSHLQVLPDGRALFACQPITFPATGSGLEQPPGLFLLSADGSTVTPVPTAPGDLPSNLRHFVVSPDGKRVAVVESETDAVAVVELETAKTTFVSPVHDLWQCRTLPSWKSATELTFAALHEGKPACMAWHADGTSRRLSTDWPAEATQDWLSERKEEKASAPAAKP